jgi:hypothetical protein
MIFGQSFEPVRSVKGKLTRNIFCVYLYRTFKSDKKRQGAVVTLIDECKEVIEETFKPAIDTGHFPLKKRRTPITKTPNPGVLRALSSGSLQYGLRLGENIPMFDRKLLYYLHE